MSISVEAPSMGESISEAIVATWIKHEGDFVQEDELIAELETDKVNLEVTAPKAGKLINIMTAEGATVTPGAVMAELDETATEGSAADAEVQPAAETTEGAAPAAAPTAEQNTAPAPTPAPTAAPAAASAAVLSPAAQKHAQENAVDTSTLQGSGKDGRITKEDVMQAVQNPQQQATAPAPTQPATTAAPTPAAPKPRALGEREERVPMSRIRKTIAGRLKQAQNTAAMLTTYNEIDLHAVNQLRKDYKETFLKQHGVKLGYMSFFTKAVVEALKQWPALNAEISDEDIIYKNYYDIGIAVASERGLVVPVVRDADAKSFAQIETDIVTFGQKAKDGKLMPDDLTGGTFSITNGGTFGSMLSMPILNYPQVGILGMHNIQERPVAVNGEVVVRPIMYVALTYDHRIVDGKEAVSFLVTIKNMLENPARMVLGV